MKKIFLSLAFLLLGAAMLLSLDSCKKKCDDCKAGNCLSFDHPKDKDLATPCVCCPTDTTWYSPTTELCYTTQANCKLAGNTDCEGGC